MSTSLHAAFNVFFANVYFVLVIFNVHGQKCDFPKVVKIPCSKNRFLVILRSIFSTYNFFSGRGWLFPVITFEEKYFNELSSWFQKQVIQFSVKGPILAIFGYLGPFSKSFFSTYRQNFQKILGQFPVGGC